MVCYSLPVQQEQRLVGHQLHYLLLLHLQWEMGLLAFSSIYCSTSELQQKLLLHLQGGVKERERGGGGDAGRHARAVSTLPLSGRKTETMACTCCFLPSRALVAPDKDSIRCPLEFVAAFSLSDSAEDAGKCTSNQACTREGADEAGEREELVSRNSQKSAP
jgi:hypothetical protein